MHFAKSKLLNISVFRRDIEQGKDIIPLFKKTLNNAREEIKRHQKLGASAAELVEKYTWVVDQLLNLAYEQHSHLLESDSSIEILAVGGYGRYELHPNSDVDLLLLLANDDYGAIESFTESFIRFLWDIGMEIGHSVRSIKDCIKEAKQDITIITTLLEVRHLNGNDSLFKTLDQKLRSARTWPPAKFFAAKMQEQTNRHAQYQDTAYSLEPNLKESPGGLRDLHMILWVYNRHYGVTSFKQMNQEGHLSDEEYRMLIRARNILWKMRNGLHLSTGRHEDRLLFDNQRELAQEFGYSDTSTHLAVEQLMKRYYRTAKAVIYLNEVLLTHYRVENDKLRLIKAAKSIDEDFEVIDKLIAIKDNKLFEKKPTALINLFVQMQQHNILGIHPNTVRSVRANLSLINNSFRANPESRKLFIQLFKVDGVGITNAMAKMNAYGVLGAYLPAFGAIVGQMQHDLFHVYTVDGHTLMVIRNINHLRKYPDRFPFASEVFNKLYKPERLFLAALFHDIAKGRGGDHSTLGAVDAYEFCIQHDLSDYDAKLISWLVTNHLFMSHFSQRRDISDPDVILEFADIVGDLEHLDNLYILTLADIRGTSPKVWNAWKGQLLMDLYNATRKVLRQGVAKPLNEAEHVEDDKRIALELLNELNIKTDNVHDFWNSLSNDYFIRNEPYYIAWHAKSLIQSAVIDIPIVSIRYSKRLEANMLFVFAPESNKLLSRVTSAFDKVELNIIEARLEQSSNNGFALYSFNAIAAEPSSANKKKYMQNLETEIRHLMLNFEGAIINRVQSSRALKHFPIDTKVQFIINNSNYTVMEVVAQDQPGLLNNVACILEQNGIKLASAKVATFGERAEDVFFIQHYDRTPVVDEEILNRLEHEIIENLDRNKNKSGDKNKKKVSKAS